MVQAQMVGLERFVVFLLLPMGLTGLIGCRDELVYLTHPPGDGSFAVLVEDGSRARLFVSSRLRSEALRADLEDADAVVLSAVVFEQRELDELALSEGEVQIEPEGPLMRQLPLDDPNARFFRADLEVGWREDAAVRTRLASLWFRDTRLCPDFEVETVTVTRDEPSAGFSFGTSLGPDSALLAMHDGRIFHVDPEHRVSEVELRGLDTRVSVMTVAGEELWVGTSSGSLYRAPRDGPLDMEFFAKPTTSAIDRLSLSRVGAHQDIFLMDRERAVWRYDGAEWTLLHRYAIDPTKPHNKDLIEVAPGHVLAVSLGEPVIVRFRDETLELEVPSVAPISGFNRLVHQPGFGTIASGTFGELYTDRTGEWAPFMQASLNVNVGVMTQFQEGVLLGYISTGVEMIYPEREHVCGAKELTANLRAEVLTRFGDGLLLSGPERNPSPIASIVFLTKP